VSERESAVVGSILGTAAGDAIGLPYEGLTRARAARLLGRPDRHRLLGGRGMVSDDTEHTCMVAQALLRSGGAPDEFATQLGRSLRLWILGLPAGVGLATLRACGRLWLGIPPARSGVHSAGNGAAMRSAILGAAVDDRTTLLELVRASTRVTHTDPRAYHGAAAIALAARAARAGDVDAGAFVADLQRTLGAEASELVERIERAAASAGQGATTVAYAASIDQANGVSGFVMHSVPVALHAWLRHPRSFRDAIVDVVECGGDTDTTAAMTGGIIGAAVGRSGIPAAWLAGLFEWPRTVDWMTELGEAVDGSRARPTPGPRLGGAAIALRNALFLAVVLGHGVRRALPPY